MDVTSRNKDGVAAADFPFFGANGHLPSSRQDIVDLFRFDMMMSPDGRSRRQHLFGKAATLDAGGGPVNERANLRSMGSTDYVGGLSVDYSHSCYGFLA
jgi:hypothetical protein